MDIERGAFLEVIKPLRAALADKSPVIGLTQIWFMPGFAAAFNDVIGIRVPCTCDFEGGIMGVPLIGLLEKSAAKSGAITITEGDALLKLAGAKATIPLLPMELAILPFPEEAGDGFALTDDFTSALAYVTQSVATSGIYGAAGITLVAEDEKLAFYTTDGKSICWARIPLPDGCAIERVALSLAFCGQLSWIGKKSATMSLSEEHSIVAAEDGTMLFGRLSEVSDRDFAGRIAGILGKTKPTPLPAVLERCFDRALVLGNSGASEVKMSVKVDKDILRLFLKTDMGELKEAVKMEQPLPPAIESVVDAALVRRGLSGAARFITTDAAFVLLGEGDRGYIAANPADKA